MGENISWTGIRCRGREEYGYSGGFSFGLTPSRHSSAYLHHSAQPRSKFGLRTLAPQPGQIRIGSSFQISMSRLQAGHRTVAMSFGVQ